MILRSALILEQSQGPRSVLAELVREAGLQVVVEAPSRDDAAKQLQMIDFDLVFLEVISPRDAVFDLVRAVRTSHSLNYRLPVIVVSADAQRATVERVRACGANAFIAKPFTRGGVLLQVTRVKNDVRAFIETDSFAGPDRRRWNDPSYTGPERRTGGDGALYV